jgi:dolichol-phosphate mannosyltransferase
VDATIRGWTSIMAVMLFFLAAQFLVLGLIGEYVGRLYMESKQFWRLPFCISRINRLSAESARGGFACETT